MLRKVSLCLLVAGCCGCSASGPDIDASDAAAQLTVPETYTFPATGGASSVSYPGQVHRHLLIGEVTRWIGGLTSQVDGGKAFSAGDVKKALLVYYAYNAGEAAEVPILLATTPPLLQTKLGEVGDANLKAKIAGNDAKGQHKDWSTEFIGWDGAASPEALVLAWFDELDSATIDRIAGEAKTSPDGKALTKVFVTPKGHDLQQLLQKFLLGAVAFSQGVDDYLDDDLDGKGLRSQHVTPDKDGAAFTTLEHQWDEGFGYFGAARDFGDYTDDEIAGKGGRDGWKSGYHDTNGDGKIDLLSEMNTGHALNCAKRDRGSKDLAPTDFTKDAFTAFLRGRALLAATAGGALQPQHRAELIQERSTIVAAWEQAIAATVLHYLNETIGHALSFGAADYDFYAHAKAWSELKGFALSLQFTRFSPEALDLKALHAAIGSAPVLAAATEAVAKTHIDGMRAQRNAIAGAYAFDTKLVGDNGGKGGW